MIDDKLLALLACPACQGDVRLQKDGNPPSIICTSCGRVYPIVDGIPVLLTDSSL
jgi:uncharacterized protein YbaR (Trm112 family)